MSRAHITADRFRQGDFFTADLSDGGVRIGLVNTRTFDVPRGHAWHDRIREAATIAEVEDYFNQLSEAFA